MEDDSGLTIGTDNQLLFDDALVAHKSGFTPTLNPPVRAEAPALRPERPWEARGVHHASVVGVPDGYRLYYSTTAADGSRSLCVAMSEDGVEWHRPDLGVVEHAGSSATNIVMSPATGSVFVDPVAPPAERFKFIGEDGTKWGVTSVNCGGARFRYFKGKLDTWAYPAVVGACSPDGIVWKRYSEPIMPWYTDTQNVAFWDERLGRYVAFVRWNEHLHLDAEGRQVGSFDYRAVARAESADFSRFPEPSKVLEPDFSRSADDDLAGGGLYNSAAIKYPCAANSYFIFTSAYHHTSDTLDVQLATSRDGIGFTRWQTPFVRLGPAGAFDAKGLYMAGGIVAGDDELYLYYGGVSTRHDIDVDAKHSGDARPAAIGRLRLRRDGFVSQDAAGDPGSLTTVPFELAGDRLQVNMDASSRGWLQVEILDASGHALWGYAAADADRLMANEVDRTVTWNGTSDLAALRGRRIRLRFRGSWVKLYGFRVVFTRTAREGS